MDELSSLVGLLSALLLYALHLLGLQRIHEALKAIQKELAALHEIGARAEEQRKTALEYLYAIAKRHV
jgi:cob(I)alamin adenosyltransferase